MSRRPCTSMETAWATLGVRAPFQRRRAPRALEERPVQFRRCRCPSETSTSGGPVAVAVGPAEGVADARTGGHERGEEWGVEFESVGGIDVVWHWRKVKNSKVVVGMRESRWSGCGDGGEDCCQRPCSVQSHCRVRLVMGDGGSWTLKCGCLAGVELWC